MIENIKHKGLKRLWEKGDGSSLPPQYIRKILALLNTLDEVETIEDLQDIPLSKLHKLTGDMSEFHSFHVSRNWRLVFKFDNGKVYEVDYVDYH